MHYTYFARWYWYNFSDLVSERYCHNFQNFFENADLVFYWVEEAVVAWSVERWIRSLNSWKSLYRWRWSFTFSKIFGICWHRFLENEIPQKFMCKIYSIRNCNDAVWIHILHKRALVVPFFPQFLWLFYLEFYCMESYKILHVIYLLWKMILI